jgi:hypothetical protein
LFFPCSVNAPGLCKQNVQLSVANRQLAKTGWVGGKKKARLYHGKEEAAGLLVDLMVMLLDYGLRKRKGG